MNHHPSRNILPDPSSQFGVLQNSAAFKHLQKQIIKMRKYFLAEGFTQRQVSEMLHDCLLRPKNQEIDWRNLNNTCEYYKVIEKFNGTKEIAESALKFKQEINQMKSQQIEGKKASPKLKELNEPKQKNDLIDVNEISDRFLYRLDHSCKLDQASSSSSSSESSESEPYSYKLTSNSIQLEKEIEQKQKQKIQTNLSEEQTQLNNQNKSRFTCQRQEEDATQDQRKKKKRKAVFQQEGSPIIEEDRFRIGDVQSKKQCRGESQQAEAVSKHNYVGKKRKFLLNQFTSGIGMQLPENVQSLAELEEIKLLERKIRYFTENEIIDEDPL